MHQVADAGAVGGVDRDRQAGELVAERGDRADVEGVPRVAVRARHAALAEDHVLLPARHHALDPQEVRFRVEGVPALVDDRERGRAEPVQQRLVLAVRLADLDAIDARVLVDGDVGGVEDLDDGREPELAARLHDQPEPLSEGLGVGRAEPFPAAVRARAVLDDAAAEALPPRLLHHARGLDDLRLALDRARPRDEDEVVTAADDVADPHGLVEWSIRRTLLRDALVRARDRDQLLDARELRDLPHRQAGDVAVDADQRDLLAHHLAGLEAEAVELLLDRDDLLAGRVPAHLDEHLCVSFRRGLAGRGSLH
jgi:hypothetical protein